MRLPSFRRLYTGDYDKQFKSLVDTLSLSINNGIQSLYDALNNGLTIRDNMKATVRDVVLSVDATGAPVNTTTFSLDYSGVLDGVIVLSATNQTNANIYPISAPFISFTPLANSVTVNNVTGLQPGNTYSLRVVAFTKA